MIETHSEGYLAHGVIILYFCWSGGVTGPNYPVTQNTVLVFARLVPQND
jgi:hypothetical protein